MARVSIEDLEFASTWVETYDGAEDDENNQRAERVVAWIDAEIAKRRFEIKVREVQDAVETQIGKRPTAVQTRAALRRTADDRQED